MKADLHVHSRASDGTLTADALVELALAEGVSVLAIADHDTVDAVAAALHAAEGTSLQVIPAVELSALGPADEDIHILGYFVDHESSALLDHLARQRDARIRRAAVMVEALAAAGYMVDLDEIEQAAAGGAIGRSHIARALVGAGHAGDVAGAFDTLIGRGRRFYVPKAANDAARVIAVIKDAGGLAVVAHPGVSGLDDLLDELVASGLDGVEAYHADHSLEQQTHYAAIAKRLGVLATGGSDYHGPGAPNPLLGSVAIPEEDVAAFLRAGARSS